MPSKARFPNCPLASRTWKNLYFRLPSNSYLLNFASLNHEEVVCLPWFTFSRLINFNKQLIWALAHRAGKHEKLFLQEYYLLVQVNWTGLFSSPGSWFPLICFNLMTNWWTEQRKHFGMYGVTWQLLDVFSKFDIQLVAWSFKRCFLLM